VSAPAWKGAESPGTGRANGAALIHGFAIAFYVLAGLAAVAALVSAVLVESKPALAADVDEKPVMEMAA
jgi:hypothetical protein